MSAMRRIIPIGFKYGSGRGWKFVWHRKGEVWERSESI